MTNMAFLIAGTSSSYLEISKKMLKFHNEKCEVDFAYSGKECVEKASSKEYQLVLFDYYLGDQTGLGVIDALKAAGVECPLIILIDEGDEVKAIKALEKGAHDYILKVRGYLTALPFTIRNILEKNIEQQPAEVVTSSSPNANLSSGESGGYFILDKRGRILSACKRIQQFTAFSEEELLQLTFSDLLPEGSAAAFHDWLNRVSLNGEAKKPYQAEVINKNGEHIQLDIVFTPIRDEFQNVQSFRGRIGVPAGNLHPAETTVGPIDQLVMTVSFSQLITSCYNEPVNVFLDKITELISQTFRFQRATLALLEPRKKIFVKQAMVGYKSFPNSDIRGIEVPEEVIQRAFANRYRVKVIYYNQNHRDVLGSLNSKFPERRTQRRRPLHQWHMRDLVLINLRNKEGCTFGYISLDRPEGGFIPTRDTFHNLELIGQLVSFAIENYHQFSSQERRTRRFKQALVTSNIFKLHLSLKEILKEIVWSVKFSTEFRLVALGLISKRSGKLEIKAAACDDKIKSQHMLNFQLPLSDLTQLLRDEYKCGKSYFVVNEEDVIRPIKTIYHGHPIDATVNGHWPNWGMLLVPIKSREDKIIGMLLADDPANNRLPGEEVMHTLEIIADRVSVAIDNRILYVQAKQKKGKRERAESLSPELISDLRTARARHRFVDRFFK